MEENYENNFFCKKCVLQFDTKNIFDIHMETHKIQEQAKVLNGNVCGICMAEFSGRTSLKSHISIYHPEFDTNPHLRCTLCEIGFTKEKQFITHNLTVHNKKKRESVCSVCKASFPGGELLTKHFLKVILELICLIEFLHLFCQSF